MNEVFKFMLSNLNDKIIKFKNITVKCDKFEFLIKQ